MRRIVLYVEDDDVAYKLFGFALKEAKLDTQIHRASDGEQALKFLRRANGYQDAPRPELILMDLNLPKRNGFDVLSEIKASESLRSIPVIIFSSSSLASDKARSLTLGAEDFVTKPSSLDLFVDALKSAFHADSSFD
jgi:chemotaxis family two-component system response regulator Rcp1